MTQKAKKAKAGSKSKKAEPKQTKKSATPKESKAKAAAAPVAAAAAGGAQTEVSASPASTGAATSSSALKNFRHYPDIENFYRFIYENDLRFEAFEIMDRILVEKKAKKAAKSKARVH